MSNNKKTETKTAETAETKAAATQTPAPAPTTAVAASTPDSTVEVLSKGDTTAMTAPARKAVKAPLSVGARMAARDPSELDDECLAKLDALRALITGTALPPELQKVVSLLVDQAAAVKPGMEEMNVRWRIPRIQITQATTTQAAKPDEMRNGELYTTAGKKLEKPFAFIPLYFSKENIMFPTGAKAPTCQAPDALLGQPFGECLKCPNLPFGLQHGGKGDQKKTDCQNQIVATVLAADLSQVYLIQFAKTSRGAGSALSQLAAQQPQAWMQSYLLDTEKGNSELGNYFKYKVSPTGKNNSEQVLLIAQALHELCAAERHRYLAEWYRGAATAPVAMAVSEGEFQGGKLDAGLGEMESYDLGDAAAAGTTPSVRSSAKPM